MTNATRQPLTVTIPARVSGPITFPLPAAVVEGLAGAGAVARSVPFTITHGHTVTELVDMFGITAYAALELGGRLTNPDDLQAVAESMPPIGPGELAELREMARQWADTDTATLAADWRVTIGAAVAIQDIARDLLDEPAA